VTGRHHSAIELQIVSSSASGWSAGPARRGETGSKSAQVDMTFQIDDAFIRKWHPKYDETENDEVQYQNLIAQVAQDMRSDGTILQERLIPLAPALLRCGDGRAIGARLQPATDKMLMAPEATA
jgi:hypothetical protein